MHQSKQTKAILNCTDLINVLALERVHELSVLARATLIDALQRKKLTSFGQITERCEPIYNAEKWVKNIILSTKGDLLSQLKTLMDTKGDYHNLHKLIYQDMRTKSIQEEILKRQFCYRCKRKNQVNHEKLEQFYFCLVDLCEMCVCIGSCAS